MGNTALTGLAWTAVAIHVCGGTIAWRRGTTIPLLPLINLATALCVVAYAAKDWVDVFTRGITWYASDQLLPAYAIFVCVFAGLALSGRIAAAPWHWAIFALHLAALLAAALFFTFFRMNRLF